MAWVALRSRSKPTLPALALALPCPRAWALVLCALDMAWRPTLSVVAIQHKLRG